jgi:hypothetical protein
MKISRQWAMPSMHTFTIKPIGELVARYVKDGKGWIDPFAGENSPAEITNDLNPAKPAKYHMHALEFAKMLDGQYDGCLFDPPYSLTQIKECYQNIGCEDFMSQDASHFPYDIKREIAKKIKPNGIVICCGWNSGGFGKKLGFEMIEILLVPHGRTHNDTIVTVERKQQSLF